VRRSIVGVVAVFLMVAGLVACSEKTVGQALPSDMTVSSTGAGSGGPFPTGSGRPTSTQPSVPRSPIADVLPCSLLSASEVAELRAGPGKDERVNNARACNFNDGDGFVLGVAIYDELGLEDLVAGSDIKPVPTVGRHKAVQAIGGIDTCGIVIEVTKTSRVDVLGTAGGNEQKSCEIALRAAKLVEPRLP
jgi:hypothetical protein